MAGSTVASSGDRSAPARVGVKSWRGAPSHRSDGRWPLLAVVAGVVAGNFAYLSGIFDPNPALTLSGLALHVGHGLLPGVDTIDPNAGFTTQALGHRAALDWLHGRVPWWNPLEGLGSPLAGEMQSAAFFPVVLLLALPGGLMWMRLVLELVGGISTYLLLRRLRLAPWVCAAAGIAFGLNGTAAWLGNAVANPVCFLPLVVLGVELVRSGAESGSPTRWYLVAVALALSVYAGFPETAYLDAVVAVMWALARLPGLRPKFPPVDLSGCAALHRCQDFRVPRLGKL